MFRQCCSLFPRRRGGWESMFVYDVPFPWKSLEVPVQTGGQAYNLLNNGFRSFRTASPHALPAFIILFQDSEECVCERRKEVRGCAEPIYTLVPRLQRSYAVISPNKRPAHPSASSRYLFVPFPW